MLLAPLFLQLRALATDGDGRYLQGRVQQVHLPERKLGAICARFGKVASPESAMVCGGMTVGDEEPGEKVPTALELEIGQIRDSFVEPVRPVLEKIRDQQKLIAERLSKEGLLNDAEALAESRALVAAYVSAYSLEANPLQGPRPLQCLTLALPGVWRQAGGPVSRADLALWLAATLDGTEASLATDFKNDSEACTGFSSVLDASAAMVAIVRSARVDSMQSSKADAMRYLLDNAWWQWILWSLLGLCLVLLSRRISAVGPGTGLVLLVWGLVAWLCRVWLPLPDRFNVRSSMLKFAPLPLPPWPVLALVVGGLALWLGSVVWGRRHPRPVLARQTLASPLAYAGWLLFSGLGWLMLLDLSATGHPRNRFLALYQQGFLWGAFALLCLVLIWRQTIAKTLLRVLATAQATGSVVAAKLPKGQWLAPTLLLSAVAVTFFVLQNQRQLTSELGRLWLILGVAWLFYLRGDLAFDLARSGAGRGLFKFLAPLLVVLLGLVLAMVVTDDKGPLLIVLYGGGIFLAAAVMYGVQHSGGKFLAAWLAGMLVLVLWFSGLTEALYVFGSNNDLTALRLESAINPLTSTNDQIGLITWFRQATPLFGYGVGNVPWCGFSAGGVCHGVPLQIQSDYTFTALWGLFGELGAWLFVGANMLWICLLIQRHSEVTSGNAGGHRSAGGGTLAADYQALLSWICVTWLVLSLCQTAVTVAGNLRVMPLTGVTYPFVSFGRISMWVNVFFLGLCLNVNRPKENARA